MKKKKKIVKNLNLWKILRPFVKAGIQVTVFIES